MRVLRGAYRLLVRRLPPRAAWALWRAALVLSPASRRRVAGPEVTVARVALGVGEEELAAVIDELVAATGGDPSKLLVVSDCDAVHVAAARGCRLEYLPPATDYERLADGSYEAFLDARGREISAAYRIARVDDAPGPEPLLRALKG